MERVNRILRHPLYQSLLRELREAEAERIFCGHDMEHFLAVARLAWIENLQEHSGIAREMIYAAALLHDMGRVRQYRDGTEHHEESAGIAARILPECGFSEEERETITKAILFHRQDTEEGAAGTLGALLYRADKASRNCFVCEAQSQCNWKPEKRNREIRG